MNAKSFKKDNQEIINWLNSLNKREYESLMKDKKVKSIDWTEEVIIPEILYSKFSEIEQKEWEKCDLKEIYSREDILEIFGVPSDKLNKCFSKKYYNLTAQEIEKWSYFGKMFSTKLPVNEVLIIYSN